MTTDDKEDLSRWNTIPSTSAAQCADNPKTIWKVHNVVIRLLPSLDYASTGLAMTPLLLQLLSYQSLFWSGNLSGSAYLVTQRSAQLLVKVHVGQRAFSVGIQLHKSVQSHNRLLSD